MMAEVQVLFEYKDSRRQLTLLPTAVCEVIGEEMMKFGYVTPIVKLSTSERASVSHADEYLLQRWSQRWNTFVDVQNVDEIYDHDRLTVIPKPVCSPQVCAHNLLSHYKWRIGAFVRKEKHKMYVLIEFIWHHYSHTVILAV